jgi:hypothetical protein
MTRYNLCIISISLILTWYLRKRHLLFLCFLAGTQRVEIEWPPARFMEWVVCWEPCARQSRGRVRGSSRQRIGNQVGFNILFIQDPDLLAPSLILAALLLLTYTVQRNDQLWISKDIQSLAWSSYSFQSKPWLMKSYQLCMSCKAFQLPYKIIMQHIK